MIPFRRVLPTIAVVFFFTFLFAAKTPVLPNLKDVSHFGCAVKPDPNIPGTYDAEAWAEHGGRVQDWQFTLAKRDGGKKGRRKALLDCADFMDAMDDAKARSAQ